MGGMVLIGRKRAAAKRAEPRQARETEVKVRDERRRRAELLDLHQKACAHRAAADALVGRMRRRAGVVDGHIRVNAVGATG